MSLEAAIKAKSVEYATMRTYLRLKARSWVEERTSPKAVNARRQLNQAFDAGVSATIELLRDREPLNLTLDEIETIEALRRGEIGVMRYTKSERERQSLRSSGIPTTVDSESAVQGPSGAPSVEADPRGGSDVETDEIEALKSRTERERNYGWMPGDRCVLTTLSHLGVGTVMWIGHVDRPGKNGMTRKCKVDFDAVFDRVEEAMLDDLEVVR